MVHIASSTTHHQEKKSLYFNNAQYPWVKKKKKNCMYHKTGIMANRAALTELGEWNCWLEERDCSSLDFRSYSSQQGLFSCRRLSCAQGYVSTCEAWCASYRCLSSLQYYTESVGEGSRESRELGLSPSSSREEKKRFLSSLKSGDRICWRS